MNSDALRGGIRVTSKVAVVIPCYRVVSHVLDVLAGIGAEVTDIFCVDDGCPDRSGEYIQANCRDPRVRVLFNVHNMGVGGAMVTGYRVALEAGADIVVKLDGDGQMDPAMIPALVAPLLGRNADYAKGNRFFNPEDVVAMPPVRILGNAVLSFFSKFSSGYWNVFDPTNGYTAIHRSALRLLPLSKLSNGYFFESDMLFRLGTIRAVVVDVPMKARYGDEKSNLNIRRVVGPFLAGHGGNLIKRIFYQYFVRDFNIASVELVVGTCMILFSALFGLHHWIDSATSGIPATSGTVMVAALPALAGTQMLLSFLNFDFLSVPSVSLSSQKW